MEADIDIIHADWTWTTNKHSALVTEAGDEFEVAMENPTIWAIIESNKGTVAYAIRRIDARTAEVEVIGWLHNTVQYHDGPLSFTVDSDDSFIEIAERHIENPEQTIEEFQNQR